MLNFESFKKNWLFGERIPRTKNTLKSIFVPIIFSPYNNFQSG